MLLANSELLLSAASVSWAARASWIKVTIVRNLISFIRLESYRKHDANVGTGSSAKSINTLNRSSWLELQGDEMRRQLALYRNHLDDINCFRRKNNSSGELDEIELILQNRIRVAEAGEKICENSGLSRWKWAVVFFANTINRDQRKILLMLLFPGSYLRVRKMVKRLIKIYLWKSKLGGN